MLGRYQVFATSSYWDVALEVIDVHNIVAAEPSVPSRDLRRGIGCTLPCDLDGVERPRGARR